MPSQPKPPNMSDLLKQAQAMQQQLAEAQAQAAETVVEGQSGGGMVKIQVTGGMEFRQVHIDPAAVDPDDVEMLEDMVLAAVRDAVTKANNVSQQAVGGLDLGGMDLGGMGLGDLLG